MNSSPPSDLVSTHNLYQDYGKPWQKQCLFFYYLKIPKVDFPKKFHIKYYEFCFLIPQRNKNQGPEQPALLS